MSGSVICRSTSRADCATRAVNSAAELTARVAAAARVVDLQIAEPDIEEIVRRIYTGK